MGCLFSWCKKKKPQDNNMNNNLTTINDTQVCIINDGKDQDLQNLEKKTTELKKKFEGIKGRINKYCADIPNQNDYIDNMKGYMDQIMLDMNEFSNVFNVSLAQ